MDAIKAFERPVREVHISNVHAPGECLRHPKPSPTGVIWALGLYDYIAPIDSRSDRGAYFSSGGYDLLLAPLRGVR
jgi:3-dehydroquinate dehydratase-2